MIRVSDIMEKEIINVKNVHIIHIAIFKECIWELKQNIF